LPKLLDLFCGAGGAAMGYHLAGFDVYGVDIKEQPRYPFKFCQADAMTFPLEGFDAIHASPPCQAFTAARVVWNGRLPDDRHIDLLTPIRERLQAQKAPWVIENVPGAPMQRNVVLCGTQFGLDVRRHRWFEASVPLFGLLPPCWHHSGTISVFGHSGEASRKGNVQRRHVPLEEQKQAMGIDWMSRDELSQAIPPAYTEWIGGQLMSHLKERAA
jgi:DNA (cytosine-5)-methyltransferase 1